MKIIKLHDAFTGRFLYINADNIDDFYTKIIDNSCIVGRATIIATTYPKSFTVVETPNDIIKQINGEENPAEMDKLHCQICEVVKAARSERRLKGEEDSEQTNN